MIPSRVILRAAEYDNADDGHLCNRMVNASLTMYILELNLYYSDKIHDLL